MQHHEIGSRKIIPALEMLKSLCKISDVPYHLSFIVSDFTIFPETFAVFHILSWTLPFGSPVTLCTPIQSSTFCKTNSLTPALCKAYSVCAQIPRWRGLAEMNQSMWAGKWLAQKAKRFTDLSSAQPLSSPCPAPAGRRVEFTLCMVKAHTPQALF